MKISSYLYLTEDLAYLTGVIMGDGHLADYFINIIDNSKEHIENLVKLLKETFCSRTEFFKQQNAQAWNVNILGKWLVRFFNFLSGQPIAIRKYPSLREPLIFRETDLYQKAFWCGLMDADGSYKTGISFVSASERLTKDFSIFLANENIKCNFSRNETNYGIGFQIRILPTERKKLFQQKVIQPRSIARKEQGQWKHQVFGYKEQLSNNGYFDFFRLPQLSVSGLGEYIQNLRLPFTQEEIAIKLNISQSIFSHYERNSSPIPILTLHQLFNLTNHSSAQFYQDYPKLSFHSHKTSCLIDTYPTGDLLNLLKGLQEMVIFTLLDYQINH